MYAEEKRKRGREWTWSSRGRERGRSPLTLENCAIELERHQRRTGLRRGMRLYCVEAVTEAYEYTRHRGLCNEFDYVVYYVVYCVRVFI